MARQAHLHDVIQSVKIIIPAIHPAGYGDSAEEPTAQSASHHLRLEKAADILAGKYQAPGLQLLLKPTFERAMDYLSHVEALGLQRLPPGLRHRNPQHAVFLYRSRSQQTRHVHSVHWRMGDYFHARGNFAIWRAFVKDIGKLKIGEIGTELGVRLPLPPPPSRHPRPRD